MEARIIDIDVDTMRFKLLKIGAEKVKMENQINRIYDFEDRRLLSIKGYARIRTVNDLMNEATRHYMTTKRLLSQDKFKVMSEHEILISDSLEGEQIFKDLGLSLVETIDKYRESYKFKDCLIEIDINDKSFCPFPYIEIEAGSEESLEEVVALLGYSMKDVTSKTIYEILNGRGALEGL
jgi:adenylate cyclase, class 2